MTGGIQPYRGPAAGRDGVQRISSGVIVVQEHHAVAVGREGKIDNVILCCTVEQQGRAASDGHTVQILKPGQEQHRAPIGAHLVGNLVHRRQHAGQRGHRPTDDGHAEELVIPVACLIGGIHHPSPIGADLEAAYLAAAAKGRVQAHRRAAGDGHTVQLLHPVDRLVGPIDDAVAVRIDLIIAQNVPQGHQRSIEPGRSAAADGHAEQLGHILLPAVAAIEHVIAIGTDGQIQHVAHHHPAVIQPARRAAAGGHHVHRVTAPRLLAADIDRLASVGADDKGRHVALWSQGLIQPHHGTPGQGHAEQLKGPVVILIGAVNHKIVAGADLEIVLHIAATDQ